MSTSQEIAECLLHREAVKVSIDPPFIWTSGIASPVYCDNRKMLGFVGEREKIVEAFKKVAEGLEFDVIGGTATAAIPWAAFLAQELHKPMIYIRPKPKDHGTGKQIEGFLKPGSKVLIIEDLISTGGSSIAAAEVVKNEGESTVTDILAIVTWEMPQAKKSFENSGIRLTTLTDYTNLINLAAEKNLIAKEDIEMILKFKEDPEKWQNR